MAYVANKITRTAVRRFLLNSMACEGMRLADLQVYPASDSALAVMISQNHMVYEVDLKFENGILRIIDMDILVKNNEKPERFTFMRKEFR